MSRIRILIVDDSVVIRKSLSESLAADPDLEVVGTAGNGQIGLAKIPLLNPDLITLDIEMPVMNGLEALAEIRKRYPKISVIMFSTLTDHGASATLDALSLGASDYATKPSNTSSSSEAMQQIREELIPKVKALVAHRGGGKRTRLPPPRPAQQTRPRVHRRIEIVAIGASTGGPNALAKVLPQIPKHFPLPIVVVQHMPPIFTRFLAERLAGKSEIHIDEGTAGAALRPGHAWIAPGNYHMSVIGGAAGKRLNLNQSPPENSCRPAVDVLFRSVALTYGPNVLGVVMTGMGADGVIGSQHIRAAGGEVIIQDEATSVVWGMPGLVHAAGEEDGVYPLDQLAGEITRRATQSRSFGLGAGNRKYAVENSIK